jgi:hypothetical protein
VHVHRLALKTPGDHQHPPHKLSLLYNGPYRVRSSTPFTVTLHLPPNSRAHPTINRDMVRKHEGDPPTAVSGADADAEWAVDHIISSSFRKGDATKLWRRRYLVAWDKNAASQTHERRDSFVDGNSGTINGTIVQYEQTRTRHEFGTALLDTLDSSWDYLHTSPRGSTVLQDDGHTTYRSFSDDTLATIATRLQHIPHMSARALLEQNVYRFSKVTAAAQHHCGNPSAGGSSSPPSSAPTPSSGCHAGRRNHLHPNAAGTPVGIPPLYWCFPSLPFPSLPFPSHPPPPSVLFLLFSLSPISRQLQRGGGTGTGSTRDVGG